MTENKAIEKLNMLNDVLTGESSEAIQIAIKALEEVQQYHKIGTPEEYQAAMEKRHSLMVDDAKMKAAKAICKEQLVAKDIECEYLVGGKCNYSDGTCMGKRILESVSKAFDSWNRRVNDEKAD